MEQEQGIWRTSDLGLAAALMAKGYRFLAVDGEDARRLKFAFRADHGIEDVETAYRSGALQVDALAFENGLRILKALVRNTKDKMEMEYEDEHEIRTRNT